MTRFARFMGYFRTSTADAGFESYYGSLIRGRQDGVPSAAEARRDFRSVRRIMDKAIIY